MHYKRIFKERVNKFVHNVNPHTEICVPHVLSDLMVEETKLPEGVTFKVRYNDVRLLFNQERLKNVLGPDNLANYVAQINANMAKTDNSPQLTDKELLMFVKSRNIQSMSELKAWSQYLQSSAVDIKNQYKDAYEKVINDSTTDTSSTDSTDAVNSVDTSVSK